MWRSSSRRAGTRGTRRGRRTITTSRPCLPGGHPGHPETVRNLRLKLKNPVTSILFFKLYVVVFPVSRRQVQSRKYRSTSPSFSFFFWSRHLVSGGPVLPFPVLAPGRPVLSAGVDLVHQRPWVGQDKHPRLRHNQRPPGRGRRLESVLVFLRGTRRTAAATAAASVVPEPNIVLVLRVRSPFRRRWRRRWRWGRRHNPGRSQKGPLTLKKHYPLPSAPLLPRLPVLVLPSTWHRSRRQPLSPSVFRRRNRRRLRGPLPAAAAAAAHQAARRPHVSARRHRDPRGPAVAAAAPLLLNLLQEPPLPQQGRRRRRRGQQEKEERQEGQGRGRILLVRRQRPGHSCHQLRPRRRRSLFF